MARRTPTLPALLKGGSLKGLPIAFEARPAPQAMTVYLDGSLRIWATCHKPPGCLVLLGDNRKDEPRLRERNGRAYFEAIMVETDFEPYRKYLTGIAYRMLGSYAEAEDVVQDAYLRWHRVDRSTVIDPRSFLARMTARLCLDLLKSARRRRETYVGPWLPEPLIEGLVDESSPAEELAGDLSGAMMLALKRLSPLERAAFLLHDIFEMGFPAVAETIGRSEESARQLASRARKNLRSNRPRYKVDEAEENAITQAFFTASRTGDFIGLSKL